MVPYHSIAFRRNRQAGLAIVLLMNCGWLGLAFMGVASAVSAHRELSMAAPDRRQPQAASPFTGSSTPRQTLPAAYAETEHARIGLVAETAQVEPGGRIALGLHIDLADQWHTYWRNPGDSGMAPRLVFELPPGFRVEGPLYPTPQRIPTPPYMTFGYEHEVMLLYSLTVPDDFEIGPEPSLPLPVEAAILVCDDICLPARASLVLHLGRDQDDSWLPAATVAELFAQARRNLPLVAHEWRLQARPAADRRLEIEVLPPSGFGPVESMFLFARDETALEAAAEQVLHFNQQENSFLLKVRRGFGELDERMAGVLIIRRPDSPPLALQVEIPVLIN